MYRHSTFKVTLLPVNLLSRVTQVHVLYMTPGECALTPAECALTLSACMLSRSQCLASTGNASDALDMVHMCCLQQAAMGLSDKCGMQFRLKQKTGPTDLNSTANSASEGPPADCNLISKPSLQRNTKLDAVIKRSFCFEMFTKKMQGRLGRFACYPDSSTLEQYQITEPLHCSKEFGCLFCK